MNPKQFLQVGGVVLLLLGVVGYLMPDLGGPMLQFTTAENVVHVLLGIVALVLAPLPIGSLKRWVVVLVGVVALFFGIIGFTVSENPFPNFYGVAELDHPIDNVLHLVVGIWALLSAFLNKHAATVA
jgi:preprotein translocase subunit Sss1